MIDGGYIEGNVYHYYLTDHLGNNRVVVNASGTVIPKKHHYPFGTAFAENTVDEQKQQPYKYNGKELDQMHGLNLYDYSARYYESAVGRFTSVDPHAENYYSWSLYAYCANNSMRFTDPTGMDWYQDDKGNVMWQEGNNKTVKKTHSDENGNITITYKNIGTSYNQRIDNYTFFQFDQNPSSVYYLPEDFQNGDFARNAQISQSPYTQGGADAIGWSFSMDGSLSASVGGDIIQYVTFQTGPNYEETYAYQTSKIGGGSETFGAGAGLSVTAYYYWRGDKSNFRSETLLGKGVEVAGSISARQVYISGAWGISQRDENGISTLSNIDGIGVTKSLLRIGLSVRKTNTTGGVKVK
ncbi:RHS repeat-associated core domain-containing protein [uncultured Dysgonomonas sp.]|uniref:RHS repeat-associated core domain-containing protein n=1 Tax=Dysgonomonas mossii TaxID=163665 RepID=UPI0035A6B989